MIGAALAANASAGRVVARTIESRFCIVSPIPRRRPPLPKGSGRAPSGLFREIADVTDATPSRRNARHLLRNRIVCSSESVSIMQTDEVSRSVSRRRDLPTARICASMNRKCRVYQVPRYIPNLPFARGQPIVRRCGSGSTTFDSYGAEPFASRVHRPHSR